MQCGPMAAARVADGAKCLAGKKDRGAARKPEGREGPAGGWAEDFTAPPGLLARYPDLRETPSADPAQRTEWNVRDADAVLILLDAGGLAASQGTALAREHASRHGKPLFVTALGEPNAGDRAAEWLTAQLAGRDALRLGIGGPRESEARGIYGRATTFLRVLFADIV